MTSDVLNDVNPKTTNHYLLLVTQIHIFIISSSDKVVCTFLASPYFILPLKNQYVDLNSKLEWVCQASGIPDIEYQWYLNGSALTQGNVSAADKDRIQVQIIMDLKIAYPELQ